MSLAGSPDSEIPVELPVVNPMENIPQRARSFQGHRAGVVTRLFANVIDFIVMLAGLVGTYLAWFAIDLVISGSSFKAPHPSTALAFIAGYVILWVYLTIAWATTGRTFGNILLGLRVVNWRGDRVRWLGAALRSTFCLWFIPGFFWVAISHKNYSVQDIVLRTSVIYDWTRREPKIEGAEASPLG
jgi:uncharacterized RDD family membrane protein YckC